jgi:SAM-dependent methyltransferase
MDRTKARELARKALEEGQPLRWFEELYRAHAEGQAVVPWADLRPNPNLGRVLRGSLEHVLEALVVGCGFGDDAEFLKKSGARRVVGFDLSPTAVERARKRFGDEIAWEVADVLAPPASWLGRFDLIFEAYTLQVLPPELRRRAQDVLVTLLRPGGELIVIARGRSEEEPAGQMPWPLTRSEMSRFEQLGCRALQYDEFLDEEEPPVRRIAARHQRLS